MHRSSKLTIIYFRNTENEIMLAPLNLHIVACGKVRTPLCKTRLIKKRFHDGQRTCSIWIYEGSLGRTRAGKVTVALVHRRKLLYAFHDCWEKPLQHSFRQLMRAWTLTSV